MRKLFSCYFLVIIVFTSNILSQNITDAFAKSFVESLITNPDKLVEFVLPAELELSNRLGITYTDNRHKFIISNDIESSVKVELENKSLGYEYSIESISDDYSKIKFVIPSKRIEKEYYFYKSNLISKPFYFTKSWAKQKSEYFEFHISDPRIYNEYSIKKLDSFVEEILTLLKFNDTEIKKLRDKKIHYFLCRGEDEIELLTDFKARGLYYLAYDYIISSFNCHYHEILHLLMNYKLQTVNLYTLPFLQEGFAVAFGGRGGIESNVILEMALFLVQSNYLDYKSLLNKSDFNLIDASMSYPISGLYTKFLIKSLSIDQFLVLYKKYSSDIAHIDLLKIDNSLLPSEIMWQDYLKDPEIVNSICISGFSEMDYQPLIETKEYNIYEKRDEYLFKIKTMIGLKPRDVIQNSISKLFNELCPNKTYQNQKYIIKATADEISVYNLFCNSLIAKYVNGFSFKNKSVTQSDGFYIFTIKKKIFDESLNDLIIVEDGT